MGEQMETGAPMKGVVIESGRIPGNALALWKQVVSDERRRGEMPHRFGIRVYEGIAPIRIIVFETRELRDGALNSVRERYPGKRLAPDFVW